MAERRFALVVATSNYRDKSMRQLKAPGFDALALSKVLRDPDVGMFDLAVIRNRDSHVVQQGIEQFCSNRDVDDTLLLYFSGHGIKDDAGNLYLAARNTTQQLLRSTGISDEFLRDVMKSCRARRQVLILDCCFGGAFARGLLSKGEADKVGINELFQGQGRVILTASTAMEFAFEDGNVKSKSRLSVFTKTLVSGLETGEADIDGDGRISVQDLYNYAYKRIALPGSRQTPTISSVGQEGEIILAQVAQALRQPRTVPALGTSVTHVARQLDLRPWVRIRDQGSEGSNPAVAAVTAIETCLALGKKDTRLSPRYIYQKAKQLDGGKPEVDGGIQMETLVRVLEEYGTVPEKTWPYVAEKWQLPKGETWQKLDAEAQEYRVRFLPVTAADEIPMHLAKGRPVLGSFAVHQSAWFSDDAQQRGIIGGVSGKKTDQILGSIALTIVDFDSARNVIHFAHTWGTKWGNAGFGEMPLSTAQATFVGDQMWAVEMRSPRPFQWSETQVLSRTDFPAGPEPSGPPAAVKEIRPTRRTAPASPGKMQRSVFDANHQQGDWSGANLPANALVRSEGSQPVKDRAANDTYDALGTFYTFFKDIFGRDSWDGKGAPLEAVIHFGRNFENAFWDGRRAVLGDGGRGLRHFHRLDIVAKEFSMGLLQKETKLIYQGQSGAVFQSVALVFSAMVKQYALNEDSRTSTWLIGDDLVEGQPLMSLENPGSAYDSKVFGKDPQVAHMSGYQESKLDNGGIHMNCGIPNRAFVLAAKALGGHSWDVAGRVWYTLICSGKLKPATTIAQFASQTVALAKSEFGAAAARKIQSAWSDVGIKG